MREKERGERGGGREASELCAVCCGLCTVCCVMCAVQNSPTYLSATRTVSSPLTRSGVERREGREKGAREGVSVCVSACERAWGEASGSAAAATATSNFW
jgi:hypothetical protein